MHTLAFASKVSQRIPSILADKLGQIYMKTPEQDFPQVAIKDFANKSKLKDIAVGEVKVGYPCAGR